MKISRELITVPSFRFGGLNIGLKKESLDFGGIVSNSPCEAAAVFTKNNFPGAPVIVGREHISDGMLQAIVVNSKNANVQRQDRTHPSCSIMFWRGIRPPRSRVLRDH